MTESKNLFDKAFQAPRNTRGAADQPALVKEAKARLEERLKDIKRTFVQCQTWDKNPSLRGPIFRAGNDELVGSPDIITSCLTLDTASDLNAELHAIYAALSQGGLFLGVLLGGQTLHELRVSLIEAETALTGGANPRVHPIPDAQELGRMIVQTGFSLPVIDVERITLFYPDIFAVMRDLRNHSCANALQQRAHHFTRRSLFEKADEIYRARFPAPDGGIAVTADLVFIHGWKE